MLKSTKKSEVVRYWTKLRSFFCLALSQNHAQVNLLYIPQQIIAHMDILLPLPTAPTWLAGWWINISTSMPTGKGLQTSSLLHSATVTTATCPGLSQWGAVTVEPPSKTKKNGLMITTYAVFCFHENHS